VWSPTGSALVRRGTYPYRSASATGNRTLLRRRAGASPKRGLLRRPSPDGRDLEGGLDDESPPPPTVERTGFPCWWSPRWDPTGDPALPRTGGAAPRPLASSQLGAPHSEVHPRSSPGLNPPIDSRGAGGGSAYHRQLASAAGVALICRNTAGMGDRGRMWSQSLRECPPTWSQFGRSPATRRQPAARSQAAELG
jgi:hypothetical protein